MLTIDDHRTRDMDDAVEVLCTDTGWTVRVSIADVARQVPPGSDLDVAARERGATQYFATGNSPMLPRDLAEWKLSLFPDKIRKSLNVEVLFDREMKLLSKTIVLGEVVSKAKLNYTEIPAILTQEDHPQHANVRTAKNMALGLLAKRQDSGALIFFDLNKGWVTTEDGILKKMKKREDTIGYIIIQELMILTNVVVAQYLTENQIPALFRNHEARSAVPERQVLMDEIVALLDAPVVDLESLQKRNHMLFNRAEYGVACTGHYGLNEKAYTHFTSPIRRYADLVVHQQLRAHLKGEPLPHTEEGVAAIAVHLNTLNQELRDRTKQSHVAWAESRARENVDARRLDGLSAKDFERVVKMELRSGDSPSDSLVEAWTHRLDQNTIPTLCMTEVLMHLNGADGWDMLREATVEALEEHPADAVTVLHQAQALGWRAASYEGSMSGPAHVPMFTARVQLSMDVLEKVFEAKVTCTAGGSAKLAKQRAVVELLRNIVLLRDGEQKVLMIGGTLASTPIPVKDVKAPINTPINTAKHPISALIEIGQTKMIQAPVYSFEMAGPPHAPIMTCTGKFNGMEVQAVAANKKDAKATAARALLEKYLARR